MTQPVRYATATAFRQALEARLMNALDATARRAAFEGRRPDLQRQRSCRAGWSVTSLSAKAAS